MHEGASNLKTSTRKRRNERKFYCIRGNRDATAHLRSIDYLSLWSLLWTTGWIFLLIGSNLTHVRRIETGRYVGAKRSLRAVNYRLRSSMSTFYGHRGALKPKLAFLSVGIVPCYTTWDQGSSITVFHYVALRFAKLILMLQNDKAVQADNYKYSHVVPISTCFDVTIYQRRTAITV